MIWPFIFFGLYLWFCFPPLLRTFVYSGYSSAQASPYGTSGAGLALLVAVCIFAFVLSLTFGIGIGRAIGFFMPREEFEQTKKLASFKAMNNTSGAFFIGSGSVEGSTVYQWFEKTEEDGNEFLTPHRTTVSEDVSLIQEKDGEARVVINCSRSLHRFDIITMQDDETWDEYEFHIPQGSLVESFSL